MATVTATQARAIVPAKSLVEGVTPVVSTFVAFGDGATLAAGTFIAMLKIESGMTFLDGYVTMPVDNFDFAVGTSDDADRFFATASAIAMQRFTQGLPYRFSASDDATRRDIFAGIEVGTGQALSATFTMTMVAFLAKDVEYA